MPRTIWGTSYFVDRAAAIRYYTPYVLAGDDVAAAVDRKLDNGEIHLGRPPLRAGERFWLVDGGTRYAIEASS